LERHRFQVVGATLADCPNIDSKNKPIRGFNGKYFAAVGQIPWIEMGGLKSRGKLGLESIFK
jgi:hypothetical protein